MEHETLLTGRQVEAAVRAHGSPGDIPVRFFDLDEVSKAPEVGNVQGQCFTYTPGRVEYAYRVRGTRRDFTSDPDRMFGSEPADEA